MSDQLPTIGRFVLFRSSDPTRLGNSASEVLAIITRVWSDICVNLTVFRDAETPVAVTSASLNEDVESPPNYSSWRWPPRV